MHLLRNLFFIKFRLKINLQKALHPCVRQQLAQHMESVVTPEIVCHLLESPEIW